MSHLEHIKEGKTKSFAHRFNAQSMQINQSNLKFLGKLEKVRPFARYTSYTTNEDERENTNGYITPYQKKRIFETEK